LGDEDHTRRVILSLDDEQFNDLLELLQPNVQELRLLREINDRTKHILAAVTPPLPEAATQISILFSSTKEPNMPVTLPAGGSDDFYIYGTAPFLGALLGPGQTISLVSADPATVALTPDSPAKPVSAADATTDVPAGTPTILSGQVSGAASPAQPNVAIVCTATVLNADGSAAESLTDTATVNPSMPKSATAIGVLFGPNAPVTSSTSRAKK
jgi:hypothetical protein